MSLVLFLMSLGSMSFVDFNKSLCRPFDLGVKSHRGVVQGIWGESGTWYTPYEGSISTNLNGPRLEV